MIAGVGIDLDGNLQQGALVMQVSNQLMTQKLKVACATRIARVKDAAKAASPVLLSFEMSVCRPWTPQPMPSWETLGLEGVAGQYM